jgi:ABC-type Fe3+/spermidine/putrescine transport system ATPase subunit
MIQLKNIDRSYKTGAGQTWVLRRINLDIHEGEFITMMGPSGAGKSSLLNVLALLDDNWQGEYWFREQAVHEMKRKQRSELAKRNIGMVFQSYHLLDDLTVRAKTSNCRSPTKMFRTASGRAWWRTHWIVFRSSPKRSLSQPAFWRTTAASWDRASGDSQACAIACRRTYRQPALLAGQGNHGTFPHPEPARNHDRASHARGGECRLWLAHDSSPRRLDGG